MMSQSTPPLYDTNDPRNAQMTNDSVLTPQFNDTKTNAMNPAAGTTQYGSQYNSQPGLSSNNNQASVPMIGTNTVNHGSAVDNTLNNPTTLNTSSQPSTLGTGAKSAAAGGVLSSVFRKEHSSDYAANPKEYNNYSGEQQAGGLGGHGKSALIGSNGVPMMETVTLIDAVTPLTISQQIAVGLAQLFMIASITLMLVWLIMEHDSFTWSTTDPKMFNLHVFFGVIGIALFFFEGVIVQRLYAVNHPHGRIHNGLMQLLNFVCLALAFYCVFEISTAPYLISLHSWLGLATAGLMVIQFLVNCFSYFWPVRGDIGLVDGVPYNSFLSYASFILGILTLLTGISEWFGLLQIGSLNNDRILGNVLGLCLLGLLLSTMYAVLPRHVVPTIERPIGAGAAENYRGSTIDSNTAYDPYATRKASTSHSRWSGWFRHHEPETI